MAMSKNREALFLILLAAGILAVNEFIARAGLSLALEPAQLPPGWERFGFHLPISYAVAAFFLFRWCYERVPGASPLSKSLVFALAVGALAHNPFSKSEPIQALPPAWFVVLLFLQSILAYGLVFLLFARSASRFAAQRQVAAA